MTEHVDELTPERAAAFVKECDALSDDRFRFIPGFEVPYKVNAEGREGPLGDKVREVNGETREAGLGHAEGKEGGLTHNHAHVLMIGMREFLGNYAPSILELTEWSVRAEFVVLAHPVRNDFIVDGGLLEQIDALEVWNQQYEGKRVPRTRSLRLLQELREKKQLLLATGGVDFHRIEHFGTPFVTLDVHELTESSILEKLQSGAFVVSSNESTFFGTCLNSEDLIKKHRFESAISVTIIIVGKFVNKVLAALGVSFPKSLKEFIRKQL